MDSRLRRIADHFLTLQDRADVDPAAIASDLLPLIYVLQIEQAPHNAIRLRVNLTGTRLDTAFNRATKGQYLEDFLHGPRAADVVAGFHRCAETHEPIWMRQVAELQGGQPRYVEGIAIYLTPGYIYGGLVMGDFTTTPWSAFEQSSLK